jgi:hypothetical protein
MRRCALKAVTSLLMLTAGVALGDAPESQPRPIPLTRPEMKQYLEDMKARTPRIPLPELTEDEKAKLGERGSGYESRLRYHYLPAGETRGFGGAGGGNRAGVGTGGPGREQDPNMTLDTPSRRNYSGSSRGPTTASIAWGTRNPSS